jgi:hypothetical protein
MKTRYVAKIRAGQPAVLRGLSGLTGAILSMVLAGCAHRPVQPHCDGPLQPINLPAPIPPEGADTPRPGAHLPAEKVAVEPETTGMPEAEGLPGKKPVALDLENLKP